MLMKNFVSLETRNDEHECQIHISNGCPADFVLSSLEKFQAHINNIIKKEEPKESNPEENKAVNE
jgi:hypothetical protein